jgi:hypothetical protein
MLKRNRGYELFQELPWALPGWWAAVRPSLHTRPPSSLSGYHPYLSLISFFLPSLLIFESLQLRSAAQHLLPDLPRNTFLHLSSLLAATTATPCCTQDQLIYTSHLVFLSFAPLIVVSANGVVFFFFSCINSSILFVASCCFKLHFLLLMYS